MQKQIVAKDKLLTDVFGLKYPMKLLRGKVRAQFEGKDVSYCEGEWLNAHVGIGQVELDWHFVADTECELMEYTFNDLQQLQTSDPSLYHEYIFWHTKTLCAMQDLNIKLRGASEFAHKVVFFSVAQFERKAFDEGNEQLQTGVEFEFQSERLELSNVNKTAGATGVCCFVNDDLSSAVLDELKSCGVKFIVLRCMGFNNVDLEYCKKIGMPVARIFDYGAESIAEHALSLSLGIVRNLVNQVVSVRRRQYVPDPNALGRELSELTVGVLGTGKIGKAFAELLIGIKCKVLVYDVYPAEQWANEHGFKYVSLDELFKSSNLISIHAPLLDSTKNIVNERTLGLMQKGSYIVNTSRGGLLDNDALLAALNSGHIAAAGLDTLHREEGNFGFDKSYTVVTDADASFAALLCHPRCSVTAHSAFLSADSLSRIVSITCDNIKNFYSGKEILENNRLVTCD